MIQDVEACMARVVVASVAKHMMGTALWVVQVATSTIRLVVLVGPVLMYRV